MTPSKRSKPSSASKLSSYSALAAVFLAGTAKSAEADIIYTDVDPDAFLVNSTISIDFNDDGINDFTLQQYNFGYGTFESNFAVLEGIPGFSYGIIGLPGGYSYLAQALNPGDFIGPGANFNSSDYGILGSFFAFGSSVFGVGEWSAVTDRYLGVKFQIGPNTHYGWIRLDAEINCSALRVKDFAYEDSPGVPILAGDATLPVAAGAVSALVATDIADSGNGSDLELRFARAADESTIGSYRAIAVPAASAPSFSLAAAEALSSDRYVSIAPAGTDPVLTFGAATRDASGAPITAATEYRCFVLSVADGTAATLNTLSGPSNPVTLLASADVARNLEAFDAANNGNGSDLRIVFDNAINETTVSEYRILVVDSAAAATFDLAAANAVSIPNYTERIPFGGVQNVLMAPTSRTAAGDLIANDQPYRIFVLSIADGTIAQNNQLSEPSDVITLRLVSGLSEEGASEQQLNPERFQASLVSQNLHLNFPSVFASGEMRLFSSDGRLLHQWAYSGGQQVLDLSGVALLPGLLLLEWQVESSRVTKTLINTP
ncbi:MAG: hypothetical protein GC205_00030 [Bacteroidetes bacterium]|nr:hypothetical protein [Bacteroidota bacterium]